MQPLALYSSVKPITIRSSRDNSECFSFFLFVGQCVTLVDYYAPLFFLEVTSVEPVDFCRKVNLCQQVATFASQLKEDSCGLCHRTVSEVLVKLKDPDTQVPIIIK